MLHALPALLDELERRLIVGEDPTPLLAGLRWPEIVGWPADRESALRLKRRLENLQGLLSGLHAPLRATLAAFDTEPGYKRQPMALPKPFVGTIHESV